MTENDLSSVARLALEDWDLDVRSVRQVSNSENIVFRVDSSDGEIYVLRMHRPGYHSFEELVSEQTWTAALNASGLDVPVPLLTRREEPYGRVTVLNEDRFTGVLEWVAGETMGSLMEANHDLTYAERCFGQLGDLLARLHNQATTWLSPNGFTRHALDAEGLMGKRPFWGPFWNAASLSDAQRRHFSEIRIQIFDILSRLAIDSDRYSLIHADLHPGNVVMNGERLHVIDFDDAGFGWHAYDLAVALKDYEDHPQFESFRTSLIKGYRSARHIDDDALALIPLFLLIRALASIGWADARPELGYPEYPLKLAAYVDERADAILARYP